MTPTQRLNTITETLLEDIHDYADLKSALDDYKTLVLELSDINLDDHDNLKDIQFDNGIAIGLTWAARCIEDVIRTKQFVRGVYKAVTQCIKKGKQSVHLLYAGTGPFATLLLPVLSQYSPEQLQVTLLEINRRSLDNVLQLIEKLGFRDFVKDAVCDDATIHTLKEKPDIIVSETMQHSLLKEQQVPIMLNLLSQVNDEVIVIPENIKLDLSLLDTSVHCGLEEKASKRNPIATVWEFSRPFMETYLQLNANQITDNILEMSVPLPESLPEVYDKLAMLTEIQVYDDVWIRYDESGLTIPKYLMDTSTIASDKTAIHLKYLLKPLPRFEYELQ